MRRELRSAPLVTAGLIGGLATASGVALTAASGWLIVQASTMPPVLTLLVAIVSVRAFGIARPVLRYAERLRSHDAALASLAGRRVDLYAALLPLTPARLGAHARSDVLTSAVRDLDDDVDSQVRVIVPILAAIVAAVIATAAAAALLPMAAVVVAAVVASMTLASWVALRRELDSQARGLRARADAGRVSALVTSNALELQAISAQGTALGWLRAAHAEVSRSALIAGRIRGLGLSWQLVTTGVSTIAMALVVAPHVDRAVSAPVAALLVFTPLALGDASVTLPDAIGAWARASAASNRLQALLAQTPAVIDSPDLLRPDRDRPAATDPTAADATDPTSAGGTPDLEVDSVVARWNPEREPLPALTLHVHPGEQVAVTGANGSGKSTLLALLARQLDPVSGSYRMGGVDVREQPLETVRASIALVDDEPHLFSSTLRENLRLARPDATDEDVGAALELAGLGRWLTGLADGLDTMLGSAGRGVSGGERSRIAVARALLSRRPVLLMDEPVAHLDHATAMAVLADIQRSSTDRTVVIISHRPDGLDRFDRVVDMVALRR